MSIRSYSGFGGLDAGQRTRIDIALAKIEAAADEASSISASGGGLWAVLIGAGSSPKALEANAAAARSLAITMRAKRDRLFASSTATEADVWEFEDSLYAIGNIGAAQTAEQLSLTQAVKETTPGLGQVFGIAPWWLWAFVGGAVLVYGFGVGLGAREKRRA